MIFLRINQTLSFWTAHSAARLKTRDVTSRDHQNCGGLKSRDWTTRQHIARVNIALSTLAMSTLAMWCRVVLQSRDFSALSIQPPELHKIGWTVQLKYAWLVSVRCW